MNPWFYLRRRPQENRENVEKSEIYRPKNGTFGEKLTFGILKTFARNGAITGLRCDKKGDRESLSPLYMVVGVDQGSIPVR